MLFSNKFEQDNFSGALIKKRLGRDCVSYLSRFQSKIGQFISVAPTVTDEVMVEMDKNKNGTGSMVLVRYICFVYGLS